MRISNNNELRSQANFMTNKSKYIDIHSISSDYKNQEDTLVIEGNSDIKADMLDISVDARSFYEEMERLREGAEASEEAFEDMGKILEIARRIARGDKVPSKDEKKLMEYNPKLYQAAKTAAIIHASKKKKEHDSLFEDEEKNNNKTIDEQAEMSSVTKVVNDINNSVFSAEASSVDISQESTGEI